MEHALRDYARCAFEKAIGPGPMARNVERSVYNWAVQYTRANSGGSNWENAVFRWRYKQKIHGLVQELQRDPNKVRVGLGVSEGRVNLELKLVPQLVYRLYTKELETKNLARYSSDVLWPEGPQATTIFKHRERDLAMEAAKAKEDDYTGLFKCGKCKGVKTTYYQMQTRSADEPMVRLLLFLRSALVLINFPTDNLRHVQDLWQPMEVLNIFPCNNTKCQPRPSPPLL